MPVERHGYMTNLLGDRAVQTIEGYARSKEPFLLSLHFTAPHWPWEGPDDEAEVEAHPQHHHRDGGTQKTYTAMVQSLDANIGRVLQALDASGLAGNTIVVFTSDNGGERFSNVWPFSGMKHELLEGGIRASRRSCAGPDGSGGSGVGAGHDHDGLDADLLAAAGTRRTPLIPPDGEDLGPIITGGAAPHPRKLYWRYKAGSQRAMRDGNWKYLRIAGNEFLFDVVQDPRERANLKDREKDVFDRLKSDWVAWNGTMLPERPRPATLQPPGQCHGRPLRRGEPSAAAAPSSLPRN